MSQPQILKVEEALNLLVGQARSKVLPRVVTISGGTCSGKTTFADRLAFRIRQAGLTAVIIPFDAYFRDFDDPMLLNTDGKRIFDVPKAYWVWYRVAPTRAGWWVSMPVAASAAATGIPIPLVSRLSTRSASD